MPILLDDGVVTGPAPAAPIPAPAYITVDDAEAYFATRLDSDAWDAATAKDKLAALVTATRAIDLLDFVGVKADPAQPLQFPRAAATVVPGTGPYTPSPIPVPVEVLIACCEEALVRLDGLDIEMEMDGVGVATTTYAGVRETYDRTMVSEGTRAGIGSNVAWNFLVPWLADGQAIVLARV